MADELKPLDLDAARARLRDARGRVDRLPNHVLRGALPAGTTALLLDVLGDLGRALDHIVALERAILGQDAHVVEQAARVAELERTAEADRAARETALDTVNRREEYIKKLLRDPCPACGAMGARVVEAKIHVAGLAALLREFVRDSARWSFGDHEAFMDRAQQALVGQSTAVRDLVHRVLTTLHDEGWDEDLACDEIEDADIDTLAGRVVEALAASQGQPAATDGEADG